MAIARCGSALLCGFALTATPVWAFELTLTESLVDQAAHVIYNPVTGDVSFVSPNDPLQAMQISSESNAFNWSVCGWAGCPPPWTVSTAKKYAFFDFEGFEEHDIGLLLPVDLTANWIISDVTADGSRLAGGNINTSPGGGPYLLIVPEPSGILLACLGFLGLSGCTKDSCRNAKKAISLREIAVNVR